MYIVCIFYIYIYLYIHTCVCLNFVPENLKNILYYESSGTLFHYFIDCTSSKT